MRVLVLLWLSVRLLTPTPTPIVALLAPMDGAVLQGSVPIRVALPQDEITHLALEFAYAQDTTDTWFPLWEADAPPADDVLATWDTFAITDGDYRLRLTITLADGRTLTATVNGLRVRNYSPIETPTSTDTPTPPPEAQLPLSLTPSETDTPTPPRTPTPLPTNPAEITPQRLTASLRTGALGALLAFLLFGLYTTLRRLWYR